MIKKEKQAFALVYAELKEQREILEEIKALVSDIPGVKTALVEHIKYTDGKFKRVKKDIDQLRQAGSVTR